VIAYSLVFVFCSFGFYLDDIKSKYSNSFFILLFSYLLFLIGLRYEIGGDWINYFNNFQAINNIFFSNYFEQDLGILFKTEPVLVLLNLITPNIYIFNLSCSFIFLLGLFVLISSFDDKYLSIVIAIPFLILLVALGYQKQSVTLGFLMLSYNFYIRNNFFLFIVFALISCLSHYSASFIIIFILYDLIINKKTKINLFILILFIIFIIMFIIISFDKINNVLINNYILEKQRSISNGVIPRLSIQIISIIFFFISYKYWNNRIEIKRIILFNIILTILTLPFVTLYSNLIDRMLFYFMIIQLMIFGNYRIILYNKFYLMFRVSIYTLYLFLTFFWFTFSYFADYWVPYNNILFPIS